MHSNPKNSRNYGIEILRMIMAFFVLSGIFLGILLALLGVIGCVATFVKWTNVNFGLLDASILYRDAITSGTVFAVGMQLMLAGFFINILKMGGYRVDI